MRGRYVRLSAVVAARPPAGLTVEGSSTFIPEDVADPSLREPGEELWVELTVPPKGPPRPLQLAVKTESGLEPLALR